MLALALVFCAKSFSFNVVADDAVAAVVRFKVSLYGLHSPHIYYLSTLQHIVSQVFAHFLASTKVHSLHATQFLPHCSENERFDFVLLHATVPTYLLWPDGTDDDDELLSTTHKQWVLSSYDSITMHEYEKLVWLPIFYFHNHFAFTYTNEELKWRQLPKVETNVTAEWKKTHIQTSFNITFNWGSFSRSLAL